MLPGCKSAYEMNDYWKNFIIIEDANLPEEIKAVNGKIATIGKVEFTDACKSKIEAARKAYDALSKELQALVLNYDLLVEAEETYKQLEGTGIANINSDNSPKDGKYLENGKIVIVKNGEKFNISGLRE